MATYLYHLYKPFAPIVVILGVTDTIVLPRLKPTSPYYYFVSSIQVTNLAGVSRTFNLHLRSANVAASAANQICKDLAIDANALYQMPIGPLIIPANFVLSGLASSINSINVILTGCYCVLPSPKEMLSNAITR